MTTFLSIFGRSFAAKPDSGSVIREEGFADFTLPISDFRMHRNGAQLVTARAVITNQVVGFSVELGPEWKTKEIEDIPMTLYWGAGYIRSVGIESDALLATLAREYGAESSTRMAQRTPVTLVSFGKDPRDLREVAVEIKIFFEQSGEKNYGEAFVNIDLANRVLEFREKDLDYRKGVIASLSESIV